jgi:hypothetical protein
MDAPGERPRCPSATLNGLPGVCCRRRWGIIAVAVFGLLFGTIGLLFAVPAMVVVMVVVERLYVRRVLEQE